MADPAIGYYFKVSLDGKQFAVFTKVQGLGAKYEVLTVKEGGQNTFVHTLTGRVTYDNIQLHRPVDASSGNLAAWFTEYQHTVQQGRRYKPQNLAISACNADDEVVATWSLLEVIPVSYKGPSFNAGGSEVLTEVIEFAHKGFWSGSPGSPAPSSGGGVSAGDSLTQSLAGAAATASSAVDMDVPSTSDLRAGIADRFG